MILGIIGGIGSGKSTVTDVLKNRYGFHILRTDDMAKELELPGHIVYERLKEAFGEGILTEKDGPIDKEAFAELIYSDDNALKKANGIIHPAVWAEVGRLTEKCKGNMLTGPHAAVETALPNDYFENLCDEIWYIHVDREMRIKRLMKDRGYTYEKCLGIISNQMSEEDFRSMADKVIDNSLQVEETIKTIGEILK